MTEETPQEKTRFYWVKKGLSFFGIVVTRKTHHPVHLTKTFFVWILILIGLGMLGGVGMYSYSTNPSFCNSCHIMEPYYNAWKTSKHHGSATCVDCHYPPSTTLSEHLWHKFQASSQVIKYVTRTYSSKPFADVEDASCLRSGCHSTRLLEGKIITASGVKFDHRPHLMEKRRGRLLRCVSCHSQIVVGKHIEVTYDTCFLCHFKQGPDTETQKPVTGCLQCHELPTKDFAIGNMNYNHKEFVTQRGISCENCHLEVTRGEGAAKQDRCFTCHNQPEKLAKFDDIPFIHENHVTKHHVACLHCHEEMRHGLEGSLESAAGTEGSAHGVNLPFNCNYCHEDKHMGQIAMYSGKVSALGFSDGDMPSPMYLANVDCIGCHYEEKTGNPFAGKSFKASEEACVKCHGASFKGIWEETKTELTSTVNQLKEKLDVVQAALKAPTVDPKVSGAVKDKLAQAEKRLQFVRAGHGEHNIYLAAKILREEDALLSEVASKLGATAADLSSNPLISGSYCGTLCHSRVGVKVPPETVTTEGKTMPHKMHTEMMGCVACHAIGSHKQVPLKADYKETCKGCH